MKKGEYVGEISAKHAKAVSEDTKPFEKWGNAVEYELMAAPVENVPKGLSYKIFTQFFERLKEMEIEQIQAKVKPDNEVSGRIQESLVKWTKGNAIKGADGSENKYVINIISAEKLKAAMKIDKLRGIIKNNEKMKPEMKAYRERKENAQLLMNRNKEIGQDNEKTEQEKAIAKGRYNKIKEGLIKNAIKNKAR
jgi:hypothetical protein